MLIVGVRRLFLLLSCAVLTVLLSGCNGCNGGGGGTPAKPATYAEEVSVFTRGAIALETGDNSGHAATLLAQFTQMAPEEPAGWANLGLLQLRDTKLDKAAEYLNKAAQLAPNNSSIQKLLAMLQDKKGDFPGAIDHYKKAVSLNPDDIRARYSLVVELFKQNSNSAEALQQLSEIVKLHPDNLYALSEQIRLAALIGDAVALNGALTLLKARSQTFDSVALEQLKKLETTTGPARGRAATILQNFLRQNPAYSSSYAAVVGDNHTPGDPIEQFIKLKPMIATPAAPDTVLTFTPQPLSGASASAADWVGVTWLSDAPTPTTLLADGRRVQIANGQNLAFPGGPTGVPPGPDGILPLDVNYDLLTDFALAGRGGFRLYQQNKTGGSFTDVTTKMQLPASVLNAPYFGAWQVDIEADGDIDIVLAPLSGAPFVLRNNGDGTWKAINPFPGVSDVRQFAWVDLDGDGNPDAVFLDAQGKLHVYMNQRAGLFRARPAPTVAGKIAAITSGAITADGQYSLIALEADGKIVRISDKQQGADWTISDVVQWTTLQAAPNSPREANGAQTVDHSSPPPKLSPETARLFLADLDNNGGLDIVATTPRISQVWLCDEKYGYQPLPGSPSGYITAVANVGSNGRLDLFGIDAASKPLQWVSKGARNYNWQEIRPHPEQSSILQVRAKPGSGGSGNNRTNPFGIGSDFELRAGLLYERQEVLAPVLHFGMGTYPALDALRIVWPNGDVRSEFADELTDNAHRIAPNKLVTAVQRLNVSCPFLFAWNGKEMQFVTDCIWRSPLGLKINAFDTAGVTQTEDWLKIRGDQLVSHDGLYDLRITAELWETHFFDHLSLLTVDHPVGTDIWVDERFAIPPPPHQVYVTSTLHPIAKAVDDRGTDVTDIVRERDGRHLDTFGLGQYQGVTRDHWVEITLPEDAPKTGPLWLICNGWVYPTNSSINVALGQSHFPPPQGLSLETPDAQGRWSTVRKGLGFPEGKVKTILLSLDGLFKPGAPRKLRLRTNLVIYWDAIQWAIGLPQTPAKIQHLGAKTAELRYRGFSVIKAKDASSEEIPQSYDQLETKGQQWRDLIGYCTRYGDVRELLAKVDDRYVIMNAGDEMRLTFAAPPPPPAGMVRDYVLIGDGWVKDGNYNTTYSKTVLPLPAHDIADYNRPPGRLEDDPVYRRHRRDWEVYHTRYVAPDEFVRGLRPNLPATAAATTQERTTAMASGIKQSGASTPEQ
jgi:tetratricopeptide (TPR) repeat protein